MTEIKISPVCRQRRLCCWRRQPRPPAGVLNPPADVVFDVCRRRRRRERRYRRRRRIVGSRLRYFGRVLESKKAI